jgi:hypothetical protein
VITIEPTGVDFFAFSSHIRDIRRAFPMIFHPLFQRSILEISKIVEESTEKGFIVNLRPFGDFRAFGLVETMLLVFTEFQRQGIGRAAISLLNADEKPRFFVSAISNSVSTAFFKMQSGLILTHENPRYKVYQSASL